MNKLLSQRTVLILLAVFLISPQANSFDALEQPGDTSHFLDLAALPAVEDIDIFGISTEFKAILDKQVRKMPTISSKSKALHLLLFDDRYLGIEYAGTLTRTAQETLDYRSGNCISLASLYVASARYVGLKAHFQAVDVPREWIDEVDYYVVPTHVNVIVEGSNSGRDLIVEITDTYSAQDSRMWESEIISDVQVEAEYYNNIAIESLQQNKMPLAMSYLLKSIETYPKVGFVWSNLGVMYKKHGFFKEAEEAYNKALKYDKKNLSVLTNLYAFYTELGRTAEAKKLSKKVAKYSKKNPYYLAKIARSDIGVGRYKQAESLLNKAIKINPDEPKFYLEKALIFFKLGDYRKSIAQVEIAKSFALDEVDEKRYDNKLDYIRSHQKKI